MTEKHEQNPTSAVNFVEKIPCPFDEVNIEPNLVHKVVINIIFEACGYRMKMISIY